MTPAWTYDPAETVEAVLSRWGFGHRKPSAPSKGEAYGREVFRLLTGEVIGIFESPGVLTALPAKLGEQR
jgi:hypothetical protein